MTNARTFANRRYVGRKSHGSDILFRIVKIVHEGNEEKAFLRGVDIRLYADAPLCDLEKNFVRDRRYRQEYIKKFCLLASYF